MDVYRLFRGIINDLNYLNDLQIECKEREKSRYIICSSQGPSGRCLIVSSIG